MVDSDKTFKQKGGQRIEKMWTIMSAIGLWANVTELISTHMNEQEFDRTLTRADPDDGEKDCDLVGLLGCAMLAVVSAIDHAGELKADSRFLDLALVIGNFLELSHDLSAYGIKGACVCWRKEAVRLFKKAELDPNKAFFDTEHPLKLLENGSNIEPVNLDDDTKTGDKADTQLLHHQHGTEKDPCAWSAITGAYKKEYENTIGLRQCDITKVTRAERPQASFDGKNLLADIPVKNLRRNFLEMM